MIAKAKPDAMIVLADRFLLAHRLRSWFAGTNRLPAIYPYRAYVDAGGLLVSRAGTILISFAARPSMWTKILKGEKPAEVPVQEPTNFELVVNLKTAKALGLTISAQLQQRADDVIE